MRYDWDFFIHWKILQNIVEMSLNFIWMNQKRPRWRKTKKRIRQGQNYEKALHRHYVKHPHDIPEARKRRRSFCVFFEYKYISRKLGGLYIYPLTPLSVSLY